MLAELHDTTFSLQSQKHLQVLSTGEHNANDGPDFHNVCMLIDGKFIVADAEFHKKSSDWELHSHSKNYKYDNVKLHIVLEHDKNLDNPFETLVLDRQALHNYLNYIPEKIEFDYDSLEELQKYALERLLRRTMNIYLELNQHALRKVLVNAAQNYLEKYYHRKRRPIYNQTQIVDFLEKIPNSILYDFLFNIKCSAGDSVSNNINKLLENKIYNEGYHLRLELILNAVLPIAFCLADISGKYDILLWYWSKTSDCAYQKLYRKYPNIPQDYLWQQQGMLELMRNFGNNTNNNSDKIHYNFSEYISFCDLSQSPFTFPS